MSGTWLRRFALLVAVAAALAVHVRTFRSGLPDPGEGDGRTYFWPARSLAAGRGFLTPNPVGYCFPDLVRRTPDVPDTVRTPGYPLLIAAVIRLGLPPWTIIAMQHLLAVAMAVAVFLVTDRVTGRWTAALAAALFFTLFPPLVANAQQYMTDVLEGAVVLAAMLAAWRASRGSYGWAVAAGLLSGYATLVRPIAMLWFAPLAVVLVWRARRAAVAFLVAALLLPGAWMARNWRATGVATLCSIDGENLLFYRAAGVLVVRDAPRGWGFFALQRQHGFYPHCYRWKPALAERAIAEARRDGIEPLTGSHAQFSRYFKRIAARIMLRHWPETLELMFSGLVEIFIGPYFYGHGVTGIVFALLALICAGHGLRRIDVTLAALIAATIGYFALMGAGGDSMPRFAIPFAAQWAIAFGAGLDALLRKARSTRSAAPTPPPAPAAPPPAPRRLSRP